MKDLILFTILIILILVSSCAFKPIKANRVRDSVKNIFLFIFNVVSN